MNAKRISRSDDRAPVGGQQQATVGPGPWHQELDSFMRAFSGAFVFGVPLLFTMEMWWIGGSAEIWKLLIFLGLTFLVNMVLSYFTGFKEGTSINRLIDEAIDTLAVGIVASTVVLMALNRFTPSDPLNMILGMIIIQTVPLSIGASVANAIFGGSKARDEDDQHDQNGESRGALWETLNDLGATATGAIFIGFSIAPTDEVRLLATEIGMYHELALIAFSLVVSYIIVFESEFTRPGVQRGQRGPFQHPITETFASYLVSLLLALVVLFLFDQVTTQDPLSFITSQVLVLGLPMTIGGAAGRLVI